MSEAITWTNEKRKLTQLIPWPRNPRYSKAKTVKGLKESKEEFGQPEAIAIGPNDEIYNGHQRLKAWLSSFGDIEIDVRVSSRSLSEQEREKLTIMLHAGATGQWNWDGLANFSTTSLENWLDSDTLATWNADAASLALMLETEKEPLADVEPELDRAAELQEKWSTSSGQLWTLDSGKGHAHRLICGDCTDRAVVERVMGGEKPLLMVTDPPYGVEYDASWRAEAGINKNTEKMGKVTNDDNADWSAAWALFSGDVAYVYHAGVMSSTAQASLEAHGFEIRAQIIWAKDRMALSRGDYHWQHEPCWYAVRKGKPGHRTDDRKQTTLWEIPARDDSGHGHSTQKPLECMARPIRNHDSEFVYDPFAGSGTTLIACEQLGRACRAVEISPAYTAVCLQRFFQLTGIVPTLAA